MDFRQPGKMMWIMIWSEVDYPEPCVDEKTPFRKVIDRTAFFDPEIVKRIGVVTSHDEKNVRDLD